MRGWQESSQKQLTVWYIYIRFLCFVWEKEVLHLEVPRCPVFQHFIIKSGGEEWKTYRNNTHFAFVRIKSKLLLCLWKNNFFIRLNQSWNYSLVFGTWMPMQQKILTNMDVFNSNDPISSFLKTSNISSKIYLAKWCITRENFAGIQSKILTWNLVQLWPQKLLLLTKPQCPECGFYLTLYFDIFCWWRAVDKWYSSQQLELMSTDCYWKQSYESV